MSADFRDKRVFLVGGPGGVGKTTLAAALAIRLAQEGHRTVVLTVDPARRLAQALGFEGFQKDLQQVTLPETTGTLHATMLDTQRYFDKIIDRFARSPEQKERILHNPIYRTMVDTLGGTHEYAAMERLLEFAGDDRFDKVVVDTPPTQNALDLLSAPQRLADFMDNSVLRWFQGGDKPRYLQFFKTGTRMALKLIQRLFGSEFMDSFARFMDDIEGMQAGFRRRNLEVLDLLKSPHTAFVLVTYPSEVRYAESIAFLETLRDQKIQLSALVLNRVEPSCHAEIRGTDPRVAAVLEYYQALYAQQKTWIDRFSAAMKGIPIAQIARQGQSVHDVTKLSQLGSFLVD